MEYQSLYRRYRPQKFSEVRGQQHVIRALQNAVRDGRVGHAYLLSGPRGTGKTTLARILAKVLNCEQPSDGEPCGVCGSCKSIEAGTSFDLHELDAASNNKVDDMRDLLSKVALGTPGRTKVYLLDEVHMLSSGAENALLKTLEEPPDHVVFVLATTEAHKVETTIISRCQRFDLRRIPLSATVERLAEICRTEGYSLEEAALEEIGRSATGSLRDAINGLEQVVTYYGQSPSLEQVREALGLVGDARSAELARLAIGGDLAGGLALIAAVRDDGADMKHFCKQVVGYLRNLLLAKTGALEALDLPREAAEEAKDAGGKLDRDRIVRVLRAFALADFRDDSPASAGSLPPELAVLEVASGGRAAPVDVTPPTAEVVIAVDDSKVDTIELAVEREIEAAPRDGTPVRGASSTDMMGLLY